MIVLVLLARDEEDVVGAMLEFHLATGVDHVIATDHRSVDGTTEILRRFESDGVLTYVRDDRVTVSQRDVMTGLARRAAEIGADWVIAADADEFWWCREGPLPEVLDSVPPRYGAIRAPWRHFVLCPDDSRGFHERLTLRCRPASDHSTVYHRHYKTLFRGSATVELDDGNHNARGVPGALLRGWFPIEVLHFPLRSTQQARSKLVERMDGFEAWGAHKLAARATAGGIDAFLDTVRPTSAAVAHALEAGELVEDLRVRDAIEAIRQNRELAPQAPTLTDDLDFARDVATTVELDPAFDALRRAEAIERALARR